jgi:S1-C subfamily serine protease
VEELKMTQPKRFRMLSVLIAVVLAVFALSFAPLTAQALGEVSHPNDIFTTVYDQASPSVVAISVATEQAGGSGSGFVIDTQGHIITNAHVVDEAIEIIVNFLDGTITRAELIGIDLASDIAVIKVDLPTSQLNPIPFGNSDDLIIGQTVLAIGSPFGQRWTLTSGIVSALDRTIQGLTQFSVGGVIQTDASINPGNSGGPLINLSGEVIGVNSQIISQSRSSSGIGFAIPANLTYRVAQTLIEKGEMEYSYIGISGGDVTLNTMEMLDLPNNFRGVVVGSIVEDGPAANSNLQEVAETRTNSGELVDIRADIITAIDGTTVNGMNDLITYLARNTQPDQTVTLTVLRNGVDGIQISITLGKR